MYIRLVFPFGPDFGMVSCWSRVSSSSLTRIRSASKRGRSMAMFEEEKVRRARNSCRFLEERMDFKASMVVFFGFGVCFEFF